MPDHWQSNAINNWCGPHQAPNNECDCPYNYRLPDSDSESIDGTITLRWTMIATLIAVLLMMEEMINTPPLDDSNDSDESSSSSDWDRGDYGENYPSDDDSENCPYVFDYEEEFIGPWNMPDGMPDWISEHPYYVG